jgi:hypothetical protein
MRPNCAALLQRAVRWGMRFMVASKTTAPCSDTNNTGTLKLACLMVDAPKKGLRLASHRVGPTDDEPSDEVHSIPLLSDVSAPRACTRCSLPLWRIIGDS